MRVLIFLVFFFNFRLPKLSLKISSKKRKKKGSESDSGDDLPRAQASLEDEDDSNKRRSGRNTNRRKKYVENDLDLDDEEFLMPARVFSFFVSSLFLSTCVSSLVASLANASCGPCRRRKLPHIYAPTPTPAPVAAPAPALTLVRAHAHTQFVSCPPQAKTEKVESNVEVVVQTAPEDHMVVDKVLASRTSTRKVPKNLENKDDAVDKSDVDFETIEVEEFYVKYKHQSYIHCDWKTAEELELSDKRVAAKIRRFRQKKDMSSNIMDFLEDEAFNPDYTEVDRILDVTEHWVRKDQLKKVGYHVAI